MNNSCILGVDVGTHVIRVAYCKNGKPNLVAFCYGDWLRNCVLYGDSVHPGYEVEKQNHSSVGNLITNYKQIVGVQSGSKYLKLYEQRFPGLLSECEDQAQLHTTADKTKSVEDVMKDILRYALETSLDQIHSQSIGAVCITFPAFFLEKQKLALLSCFRELGIPCVESLPETIASCIHFKTVSEEYKDEEYVFAIDCGAGFLSVALIHTDQSNYQVEVSAGLDQGMESFEDILLESILELSPNLQTRFQSASLHEQIRVRAIISRLLQRISHESEIHYQLCLAGKEEVIAVYQKQFFNCIQNKLKEFEELVRSVWEKQPGGHRPGVVLVCGGGAAFCPFIDMVKIVTRGTPIVQGGHEWGVFGMVRFLIANRESSQFELIQSNQSNLHSMKKSEIPIICTDNDILPPPLPHSLLTSKKTTQFSSPSSPTKQPLHVSFKRELSVAMCVIKPTGTRGKRTILKENGDLPQHVTSKRFLFGSKQEMTITLIEGIGSQMSDYHELHVYKLFRDKAHTHEMGYFIYELDVDSHGLISITFYWEDTHEKIEMIEISRPIEFKMQEKEVATQPIKLTSNRLPSTTQYHHQHHHHQQQQQPLPSPPTPHTNISSSHSSTKRRSLTSIPPPPPPPPPVSLLSSSHSQHQLQPSSSRKLPVPSLPPSGRRPVLPPPPTINKASHSVNRPPSIPPPPPMPFSSIQPFRQSSQIPLPPKRPNVESSPLLPPQTNVKPSVSTIK